jgi:ribosomal 50S subunit-recycling heat shock protein
MIAVQKGKDRWEIARDANTKASGEMKVGDKVTVHYTMTATNIEVKPAKAEKGAQKKE